MPNYLAYQFQPFYGFITGTIDSVVQMSSDTLLVEATCSVKFSAPDVDMMSAYYPLVTWYVAATLYEKDELDHVQAKIKNVSPFAPNVDDKIKLMGRPNGSLLWTFPEPGKKVPPAQTELKGKFTSATTAKAWLAPDDFTPKFVQANRRLSVGFMIWSPFSTASIAWRPSSNVLQIPSELDAVAKFV